MYVRQPNGIGCGSDALRQFDDSKLPKYESAVNGQKLDAEAEAARIGRMRSNHRGRPVGFISRRRAAATRAATMHSLIVPCCHRAYLQRHTINICADSTQLANVVFVAAIDMADVMHHRFALCCQGRRSPKQRRHASRAKKREPPQAC